jgi:hypothetical protein
MYSIRLLKYSLRIIRFDNTEVLRKLPALRSSVVPRERPNATTEDLIDTLYICVNRSYISLCYIVFFKHYDAKSNLSLEMKNSE